MSNTNDSLHSSKPDYSIEQDFESKSHLSDSFLDGQDFTHLFSYRTPSVDSLHTPTNHSTLRKLAVNLNNIPSRSSFHPDTTADSRLHRNKMERLAKCSEFYGYPQDNGNKFLTEFESFATLHDLSDYQDKRRLAAFHLHLRGPALTWFNSLSEEIRENWVNVKILFKEKFINFSGHGANVLMHSEIFQNLTLSSGQNVEDFFCQIYEKGKLLNKPEHEMLSKFISGLPEQMSFFIRAGLPQDMETALTAAKMAEACGHRKHENSINAICTFKDKPRENRNAEKNENDEIRKLRQQVKELNELVTAKKENRSENSSSASASEKSEIAELKEQVQLITAMISDMKMQSKPDRSTKSDQVNTDRRNFVGPHCFKCKGRGHYQRECSWDGTGEFLSRAKCQLCFQEGHTANVCAKFVRGNRQNPGDRHGRPG